MRTRAARLAGWSLAGLVLAGPGGAAADGLYRVRGGDGSEIITNLPPAGAAAAVSVRPVERLAPPVARRTVRPYSDFIRGVADRYGVDQDLVHAIVAVESNYNPRAVSPRGAVGLMQLMPATAAELGVHNLTDPHDNLVGGVRHLRRLLEYYRGDLTLTLAAYNAGAGAVDRHGGVPPYAETTAYVQRVRRRYTGAGVATASGPGDDPIHSFVDERGTVVFTQYPPPAAPPSAAGRARR